MQGTRQRKIVRHFEFALNRRTRLQLMLDAMQAGGQTRGNRQIRVGIGARQTVFHASSHRRTGRNTQPCGAVVMGPAGIVRRRIRVTQTLIGVYVRRKQRCEISHARLLPADEMAEHRGRLAVLVAEHILAGGDLDQALVNVHRTARRVRQRLGHAHHAQTMLERDFLEQVFEQEGLVGQQQRITVQQIDLELADAHLMHEGIARQTEGRHAFIDFAEEWPQAIVGTDTERRLPILATPVEADWRTERLGRIGVRREDEEFQLGRHYRRQTACGVTGDDFLELATGRQVGAFAAQFVGIADGQGTWLVAPRQGMNHARLGDQREVAVIAAVKPRRWITAHDALQQHSPRHLQTPPFEETLGGHHLAARHAVQIRRDTFNLINAGQSLRE